MDKQQKVQEVRRLVLATNGKIFRVNFKKRSTGETRKMVARLNVISHRKGGDRAYDPKVYDLMTVFDMQKREYRSIPLDAVEELQAGAKVHRWEA